jgi:AraC-like DNA-binding protein
VTGDNAQVQAAHQVELVRHRVHPELTGLVAGIVGMSERSSAQVRRRQPAGSLVPVVLTFGEPLRIEGKAYGSFVAGLSTGCTSTEFERGQDCVQVYLTPPGIARLLGVPGSAVAGQVVRVDDVVPTLGGSVGDQLAAGRSWGERFALVEASLLDLSRRRAAAPDWITWMCRRIAASGGRARIGDLVAESGWSHRYVARTFGEQIGLRPKELASVVRFERATADLGRLPLAQVAVGHGYADQSHLHRDVMRYAGETPAQLAAARRPTAYTALGVRHA